MAELDEEHAWISLSQRGDHAAFEALVTRHQRMIHALTFRMTGSLADAEDLAQETFIHAHEQLAAFRGEAKFSSWLYRIALNLCLNWQKSQRRRQKLLNDWAGEQGQGSAASVTDARTQHIQEALLKLNPKQRAALIRVRRVESRGGRPRAGLRRDDHFVEGVRGPLQIEKTFGQVAATGGHA